MGLIVFSWLFTTIIGVAFALTGYAELRHTAPALAALCVLIPLAVGASVQILPGIKKHPALKIILAPMLATVAAFAAWAVLTTYAEMYF